MHQETVIPRVLDSEPRRGSPRMAGFPKPRLGARARRWLPVALILVLAEVMVALVAIVRDRDRDRTAIAAGAPAAAVNRGLLYLRQNPSDVSALIVLDYLQRKYALPAEFAFEMTHAGGVDDPRLAVWGRFVGTDRLTDEVALGSLTTEMGIEEVVMHALYCDRFLLPSTYGGLLQRFADRGDYELTHAALAMKLVRDNRCTLDGIVVSLFEERLRRRTAELIQRAPQDRRFEELDVRYEALAILQDFLGHRDISSSEIARLLEEQQSDGGWRPEADLPSAPHSTVMAVWALLVWAHPETAEVHFARRCGDTPDRGPRL
jgi:hypothetical protein